MVHEWRAKLLRSGVRSPCTAKAYRLLCSILMTAVTSERPTRPAAEAALRVMGKNGRADCDHDRRYRPLMLLAP